jgi:Asp-tRNA(Asn)/Glu-tRNA(Gln) amidotransferase A subunit family amidase
LSDDRKTYIGVASDKPMAIPAPGLPFSLVFRAEPGKEDIVLKIASSYEAASKRRVPPPEFGPLRT